MFQILNPKNSPTTTLQSEMLELLRALQSSLALTTIQSSTGSNRGN